MDEKFKLAADGIRALTSAPPDDDLLILYGFYKQATMGDNTTAQPGMFAVKDKAKWNAWNANKGLSKEAAMEKYVEAAKKYLPESVRQKL